MMKSLCFNVFFSFPHTHVDHPRPTCLHPGCQRLMTKEVPVVLQAIHDNIVEVPQVEYIEVVKEIPKVEVRYVEKTVEVPKIEYATWRNGFA